MLKSRSLSNLFKRELTGSELRENLKFSHQSDRKDPGFLNLRVYLTLRTTKRVYGVLKASRRRIHSGYYTKQWNIAQLWGKNDRAFFDIQKKDLRQEIAL